MEEDVKRDLGLKGILEEDDLVFLFIENMKKFSVSSSRGTYDLADPTHFEKWRCEVWLQCGYTMVEVPEEEGGGEFPEPETIVVRVHDVTWGVEFEFETSVGIEKGYFGRGASAKRSGEWHRTTERFFEVMADLLLCGSKEPADVEMWEDDFGMTNPYANV